MLTSDQKGAMAETAISWEAIRLGAGVLKPMSGGGRCDLVFDLGRLIRVQCKWAPRRGDVIIVNCRTCRRGPNGSFVWSTYSLDDVDLIAAYCPELEGSYAIPIGLVAGRPAIALRVAPSRNNQATGINWAKDFELAATLRQLVGP
jgi:hypothetical protein